MQGKDFSSIRKNIRKTQKQMSEILGVSLKAIQSFEQGWRSIPVHIERQVLYLLVLKKLHRKKGRPCWAVRRCPAEAKRRCPAWEFQVGDFCWFINGTICHGEVQDSWRMKIKMCRQCKVFRTMLPGLGWRFQALGLLTRSSLYAKNFLLKVSEPKDVRRKRLLISNWNLIRRRRSNFRR